MSEGLVGMIQQRWRFVGVGVVLVGLLVGCSGGGPAPGVSSPSASSPSSLSSVPPSGSSPVGSSSPSVSPSSSVSAPPSSSVLPSVPPGLSAEDAQKAEAALGLFRKYAAAQNTAYAEPGKDWRALFEPLLTNIGLEKELAGLARSHKRGVVRGEGQMVFEPRVVKVEGPRVTLTVCVDTSQIKRFFADGSLQQVAPDVKGTYWRYVRTVDVTHFDDGVWRILNTENDRNTTC